ncbi:MAG: hypothetical protein WCD45_10480 [Gallionella sp.]
MMSLYFRVRNFTRLLLMIFGALPLCAEARTQMAMPEREHVQTIVWIMEAATFTIIVVIFLLLWRFVKRDQAKRKARQNSK